MKAKYTNLINALDENTQESISFSDEKDMELLSILDSDKTKEWNYSKWVELMNDILHHFSGGGCHFKIISIFHNTFL